MASIYDPRTIAAARRDGITPLQAYRNMEALEAVKRRGGGVFPLRLPSIDAPNK